MVCGGSDSRTAFGSVPVDVIVERSRCVEGFTELKCGHHCSDHPAAGDMRRPSRGIRYAREGHEQAFCYRR